MKGPHCTCLYLHAVCLVPPKKNKLVKYKFCDCIQAQRASGGPHLSGMNFVGLGLAVTIGFIGTNYDWFYCVIRKTSK